MISRTVISKAFQTKFITLENIIYIKMNTKGGNMDRWGTAHIKI